MRCLYVYLKGCYVGCLFNEDNNRLGFHYDLHYLKNKDAQALSVSLPLSHLRYSHKDVHPFFSGLLPDDPARSIIAKHLHISSQNTFELLEAIGGECAGAVSLYTEKFENMLMDNDFAYKTLSDRQALTLFKRLDARPLLVGEDDFRISAGGAQDKMMIAFDQGQVAIPLRNTPSTHLLKPPIQSLQASVFNEFFCMQLAKALGLNVANADVLWLEDMPYYLVQRYDRVEMQSAVIRLHQEDFCQALDVEPHRKYQNEGGPSLLDCFALMDRLIQQGRMQAVEKIRFFDAVIFNFMVGNGDAHAKNFSLLYSSTSNKVTLAPLYDILSTVVYYNDYRKTKMAMKIGSKYLFHAVRVSDFIKLGVEVGFKETFVKSRLQRLSDMMSNKAEQLLMQCNNSKNASDIYMEILGIIKQTTKQLAP